jgi:7-alpha-hydroxysteroid dehydrogenase
MSLSIQGKTVIVTGAAAGIGLAIARHFLDKGANVMCADIDEVRLENECGEAARAEGPLRFFGGDLREKLTMANLLSATYDAFDRVDVLVNAARLFAVSDPLDTGQDNVELMLQYNLLSALRLSQMTARRMIAMADKAGQTGPVGSIITLSSTAASLTQPELLGYSISSAAVDQMTRSLALALAPRGIRVNAVAFASVMSASLQVQIKEHPGFRQAILDGTPLARIAAPADVAETVQFLASDAAGFMTGQVLCVDGGRSLRDGVRAPAF